MSGRPCRRHWLHVLDRNPGLVRAPRRRSAAKILEAKFTGDPEAQTPFAEPDNAQAREDAKLIRLRVGQFELRASVRDAGAGEASHLGATDARLQDPGDGGRDPILQFEDVCHHAVVPVGPDMAARLGLDQLARHPQLPAGPAHTAFKNIADTEPLPDVTDVHALALEGESRVAGDHKQSAEARQGRGDLLHDPVGEPFRVRIVGDALKRQDDERRSTLVGLDP